MSSTAYVMFLGKVCNYKEECDKHIKAIWAIPYLYFSQQTVENSNNVFLVIYTIETLSRVLMRWNGVRGGM